MNLTQVIHRTASPVAARERQSLPRQRSLILRRLRLPLVEVVSCLCHAQCRRGRERVRRQPAVAAVSSPPPPPPPIVDTVGAVTHCSIIIYRHRHTILYVCCIGFGYHHTHTHQCYGSPSVVLSMEVHA